MASTASIVLMSTDLEAMVIADAFAAVAEKHCHGLEPTYAFADPCDAVLGSMHDSSARLPFDEVAPELTIGELGDRRHGLQLGLSCDGAGFTSAPLGRSFGQPPSTWVSGCGPSPKQMPMPKKLCSPRGPELNSASASTSDRSEGDALSMDRPTALPIPKLPPGGFMRPFARLDAQPPPELAAPAIPQRPANGTPFTTLMIRNVPASYTRTMLLKEWATDSGCDFLYLPRNCESKTNMSFAFVNFATEEQAVSFMSKWHRGRLARFRAQKSLNVVFADVQGLHANIRRLERKRNYCSVSDCQCEPIVLRDGRQMPLSAACASTHPCEPALPEKGPTRTERAFQ